VNATEGELWSGGWLILNRIGREAEAPATFRQEKSATKAVAVRVT
jgi:hypothetical protein